MVAGSTGTRNSKNNSSEFERSSDPPNILLAFPDTWRYDWVGYNDGFGYNPDISIRTPTVDGLTERGVAFRNSICPTPLCGPSRACLATGMQYDRCGVRSHIADLPLGTQTLYQRLRDEGDYYTMTAGREDLLKASAQSGRGFGPDGKSYLELYGFSDGFSSGGPYDAKDADPSAEPYMNYLEDRGLVSTFKNNVEANPSCLPEEAWYDNWLGERAAGLLKNTPTDQPWFLQVNWSGPHPPYNGTEEMNEWYENEDLPDPIDGSFDPEDRRMYAALCTNVDRWLRRYVDILEERGELENTIILFSSDHGDMLGDHGHRNKMLPYQPSIGVPLVAAGPGIQQRGVVDEPATTLDLYATILDIAGIDPGHVDSQSMWRYLSGEVDTPPRDIVYSGFGPWRLVFDGQHKLIRGYDGEVLTQHEDWYWEETAIQERLRESPPELYDLQGDPQEQDDISDTKPDVHTRLNEALRRWRPDFQNPSRV